ncbi:MAG TPA: NF041680 family putative transposase [Ktedonobacterales bacterium]|nr:NF041680 family putative transposase [Ktedonobacterales bacterium]
MEAVSMTPLLAFREAAYRQFQRRRDALFEMLDALVALPSATAPVHMMLLSGFQRRWGSIYDALTAGSIDVAGVEELLARHPLEHGEAIYAVDASTWIKNDAETSPKCGYYHHHNRHSAGKPIVAGWSYQWLAQVSFCPDSWCAPLSAQRLEPTDNVQQMAANQIRALLQRRAHDAELPVFVFDAGYDAMQLAQQLGELPIALLVRLRSNRCFYAEPTEKLSGGRPRRHGAKFVFRKPQTWGDPTCTYVADDGQYGHVLVQAWPNMHAKPEQHQTRGTYQPRPVIPGVLIRITVSTLPKQTRAPKPVWLWWYGPQLPDLERVWKAYRARFQLEHCFKFCKYSLNWTTPRVRHPEQADRWTELVLLAYTMLRLARPMVADQRLPWERPLKAGKLTPYRVRRALSVMLPHLPPLVNPPKPCGRSPGRPKNAKSGPAPRYPALKKSA